MAKLARAARGGLVSVGDAARALDEPRSRAARRLAALARGGWIERAKRGVYLVRPLEAAPGQRTVAEDPWIVAHELFAPCYVGGWSAAEYWSLTDQIFASTLVVTAASVRSTSQNLLGHPYRLFRVPESRITGALSRVWRGSSRVLVSSPERTIADCLRNPALCGGVRHLADIMREYGNGADADFQTLAEAMRDVGNGAAWKRCGYLAEIVWPGERALADTATRNLTTGYSRLDPSIERRGRLVTRWRLWVNVHA